MPMVEATLASELEALVPADNEPAAINALVTAYGNYASAAIGNGIPLAPAGVESGKAAMTGALVGMSAPGAGLAKIPAACAAFWAAVCTGFAVSFPGTIAAVPPPHAALAGALPPIMVANKNGSKSLKDSASAMATPIHTDATTGGTVTLPGAPPVVGPIL